MEAENRKLEAALHNTQADLQLLIDAYRYQNSLLTENSVDHSNITDCAVKTVSSNLIL
jgi:hypothetical protein